MRSMNVINFIVYTSFYGMIHLSVHDCMIDEKLKEARLSYKVKSPSCDQHDDESCVNTLLNIVGKTTEVVFCKK